MVDLSKQKVLVLAFKENNAFSIAISQPSLLCHMTSLYLFHIYNFRYIVFILGARFLVLYPKPTDWFHVVINYFGPDDGEGIKVYHNREEVGSDTTRFPLPETNTPGEGRMALGRDPIGDEEFYGFYGSVEVEDLRFFNQNLTAEAIETLSQIPTQTK